MELEVGMYVKTKRDGIGKIISLSIGEEDECCFIELSKRRTGIKEHNILKASHSIIDLIQEGDYVNGREVVDIFYNANDEVMGIDTRGSVDYVNSQIKSIVTKEQFLSMEYKVGEK